MRTGLKLIAWVLTGVLCFPVVSQADTQTTHHAHKPVKKTPPPPLPSGTQGPVPQMPLDSLPAVAPQVSYEGGMLTIVAANSTLGDILRGVRKHTSADIDVPSNANERVATRLGPAPPREVMAELLNGSHFNYILLGSPDNSNSLVRVVLVAKSGPDNPAPAPVQAGNNPQQPTPDPNVAEAAEPEPAEEDANDQSVAAEADQNTPDQPGVKTPQQMLQEMQQRQIQMQQQQQQQLSGQPAPYPPPGGVLRPPQQPDDQ